MILLDTTILVYAVGSDHSLRSPCQQLLQWVAEGSVRASTTVEAIQEFAHVRSMRRTRADAAALARNYAVGLSPLTQPDLDDLMEAIELFRRSTSVGALDAVLAVTARRRDWSLASADRGFARISGLAHLNPASPTFLESIRAVG